VIGSLDDYLERHRERLRTRPTFDCLSYDIRGLSSAKNAELQAAVADGDAYITGGRSLELRGGGSLRTPPPPANS
jgi:hypothetical protein